jgi:multisubunit Na+/H+ antiporter MnhF subunit
VNVWLVGATALLAGLIPCGWVILRERVEDALVALELAASVGVVILLLLAEGFHRSSYFTVPLVLALLGFAGSLVFVRFFAERRL